MSSEQETPAADLMETAPGWLRRGLEAGWIAAYERELLGFLVRRYGQLPEAVVTGVLFVSLFVKAGHVCLPLDKKAGEWMGLLDLEDLDLEKGIRLDADELLTHPAIGGPEGEEPFLIDGDFLFIRRHWNQENFVAEKLMDLSSNTFEIDDPTTVSGYLSRLFPDPDGRLPDWQQVAAALALCRRLLVISGGPGTGKTTTVARIIRLLMQTSDHPLRIALAAPTGKAAARMGQSLQGEFSGTLPKELLKQQVPREAITVHRLLRKTQQKGMLPPDEAYPLPYDLIVVDEASMVDLTMMERLLRHTAGQTRLILLGDKDQLSSVEAGAVLGDICQKEENRFNRPVAGIPARLGVEGNIPVSTQTDLDDSIVYLTKSYRFKSHSGIATLAGAVNRQDAPRAAEILKAAEYPDVQIKEFAYKKEDLQHLFNAASASFMKAKELDGRELLDHWLAETWLGVLRKGPFGTDSLNKMIEGYLQQKNMIHPADGWYHGRPVLITRNDYSLGVFNGDLGVCSVYGGGAAEVLFADVARGEKRIAAHRLREYEPAYLLTVHKSQGSEFDAVNLLLPDRDRPLLTRELIYTAITRARQQFNVFGRRELFENAVKRKTERFTGLKSLLYAGPAGMR